MKTIQIEDKEYILEFTFEAAEHKLLVQKMFDMVSGAYLVKGADDIDNPSPADMITGTANMFSNIPEVCNIAFYAGFLENNPVDETEAKKIMRAYMKANDLSYPELFEEIKEEMEKDGFFRNTGLDKMMQTIAGQEPEKEPKKPQDHKKKTTK
uniref:Phage protein n=1 Tax=Siphoviridae sp. ctzAk96 TaxID=2826527 RepID=A0A8S5QWY0_9CAUD|nr:MAG TPA: hypothetical protein [Siphoviridae sp. ctzAk96]